MIGGRHLLHLSLVHYTGNVDFNRLAFKLSKFLKKVLSSKLSFILIHDDTKNKTNRVSTHTLGIFGSTYDQRKFLFYLYFISNYIKENILK